MITDNGLKVICKVLSGRWLISVVAAIVFLVTSVTGQLKPEDVKLLLAVIITFYFQRKRGVDK